MLDVIKVEIEKQIARLEQLKSQEIAKQRVNAERQFITPKNVELEKAKNEQLVKDEKEYQDRRNAVISSYENQKSSFAQMIYAQVDKKINDEFEEIINDLKAKIAE